MKPDLLKFEANGVAAYHTNATAPSRDGEEELGLMSYARTNLTKYV
jgi:hypothetical protein